MKLAYLTRFVLPVPEHVVTQINRATDKEQAVCQLAPQVPWPHDLDEFTLRAELFDFGIWSLDELQDSEENWRRIVYIACCNVQEDEASQARLLESR